MDRNAIENNNPQIMNNEIDQIDQIPFTLSNGVSGTAMVMVVPLTDGRTLVTCANVNEEDDAPVNMAVETLFHRICDRHRLDRNRVVWVECTLQKTTTATGELGGWERVEWDGPPGSRPKWRSMTPDQWEDLGAHPPPAPY